METSNHATHAEMVTYLSEAIDSMIDGIESGRVGFDYAVKDYADQADNALASAFKAFVTEMKLVDNQPIYGDGDAIPDLSDERRAALLNVARRIDVPEVTTFVNGMIEAQDQRINVVKALRSQAELLQPKLPPA